MLHVNLVANLSTVTGLDPHLSSVIAPLDDYAVLPIAITVIPEQASNLHALAMHGHCDPVDGREFFNLAWDARHHTRDGTPRAIVSP